jgi:hypothetical protein
MGKSVRIPTRLLVAFLALSQSGCNPTIRTGAAVTLATIGTVLALLTLVFLSGKDKGVAFKCAFASVALFGLSYWVSQTIPRPLARPPARPRPPPTRAQELRGQSATAGKRVEEISALLAEQNLALVDYHQKLQERVRAKGLQSLEAARKDPYAQTYLSSIGELVTTMKFLSVSKGNLELKGFKLEEFAKKLDRQAKLGAVLDEKESARLEAILKETKLELEGSLESNVGSADRDEAAANYFKKHFP